MTDFNLYAKWKKIDENKYLDEEGVKYLWSKINMNDYPNNEILMSVIQAIDETKVDKIDGKGLSTNDFTNEYKEKLDGLENYATESYVNEGLATKQPIGDYALKSDIPDATSIDTTLTQEGMAADAKAVGDALNSLFKIVAFDDGEGNIELKPFLTHEAFISEVLVGEY